MARLQARMCFLKGLSPIKVQELLNSPDNPFKTGCHPISGSSAPPRAGVLFEEADTKIHAPKVKEENIHESEENKGEDGSFVGVPMEMPEPELDFAAVNNVTEKVISPQAKEKVSSAFSFFAPTECAVDLEMNVECVLTNMGKQPEVNESKNFAVHQVFDEMPSPSLNDNKASDDVDYISDDEDSLEGEDGGEVEDEESVMDLEGLGCDLVPKGVVSGGTDPTNRAFSQPVQAEATGVEQGYPMKSWADVVGGMKVNKGLDKEAEEDVAVSGSRV
ncbi:hypothetical protein U1Q18_031307, partial [Sarracenia purpurea var. burkii]